MKILISPLDWGLGHATRLIPIIKKLSDNGNDIIIAGDGKSFELIKNILIMSNSSLFILFILNILKMASIFLIILSLLFR